MIESKQGETEVKRTEYASNGMSVVTAGVLVQESNVVLVHQAIHAKDGTIENSSLVTLSKGDIFQLYKEYCGEEDPSYCHYCDHPMFEGDKEYIDGSSVCCSEHCVEARQAQR